MAGSIGEREPTASSPGHAAARELAAVRICLRPLANPLALGCMGLAVATILATGLELSWIGVSQWHSTGVLIIAFAPSLQIVSCVFGFLARDAVAATSMGIQAATWLCVGLSLVLSTPGSTSHELGLLLLVAGTGVLFSATTAAQSKLVPALVLGLTSLRFILTGIYELNGGPGVEHAAGVTGVVLCAAALYGALSLEVEDTRQRTVLPTLRRGRGKQALELDLGAQVQRVAAEAGVRKTL